MSDYEVGAVMATADMKAARDFYENKLGLTPAEDQPGDPEVPITYQCGKGTGISVYLSPDHAGKSTATMAGWVVDDVDKVVDELTEKGVEFERYDGSDGPETNEKGVHDAGDGFKVAFMRDPDGNTHAVNSA
jgi:catechol 2,3-dioxygenase-like lactoylglutathione lyase family enzyme